MATMIRHNHHEAITHTTALPKLAIPVLVAATGRRDGQSFMPTPKMVRGRKVTPLAIREIRLLPGDSLKLFIDRRTRQKFEHDFGPVPPEDTRELLFLLGLAGAVSIDKKSVRLNLRKMGQAVSRYAGDNWELDSHLYSEVYHTPLRTISGVLNRRIQKAQFIVWWMEREKMFVPGFYCDDAITALFVLAAMLLGKPGALRLCPHCGNVFFGRRAKQTYCSYRCQTAAGMQRYRSRKAARAK